MTSSFAQRLVRVSVCALMISALACREDPTPPSSTGGSGGSGGSGGKGGSGGRAGSGGSGGSGGSSGSGGSGGSGGSVDAGNPDKVVSGDGKVGDGGSSDGPTAALRPFNSHPMAYPAGTILPSSCATPGVDAGVVDGGAPSCPQAALDQAVADFYDKWKTAYFKTTANGNCAGLSYVAALPGGDFPNPNQQGEALQSVSELQGMGMLISVVMAGHDPKAQTNFDNLLKYARKFKSGHNDVLMSRDAPANCPATLQNPESQTDGDLDIALALLMADKQWGSGGAINYLDQARAMIAVMKISDMTTGALPVLGDWVVTRDSGADGGIPVDPKFSIGLRSSDLMPGHFRAFSAAASDGFWMQAIDNSHSVLKSIQNTSSMVTGLIPDFIDQVTTTPVPAPADWSAPGQPNDGDYSYHAARVPLRLAADYLTSSGEPAVQVKALLTKIEDWITGDTSGDPANIRDGYQLDGTDIGTGGSFLFEAPLGAAAIVDTKYQAWLNAIWNRASVGNANGNAHDDSVRLLSLIVMSGNWWAP